MLAAAPVVAFYVLRMREMSPPGLPDPTMHSVYLWDPSDLVRRYKPSVLSASLRHYIGPPAAYFRWGTRPGFLVPGRLAYLAFGPVRGFLALRYVLALIAIVPTYQLGKRCYGAPVGALGVCLVLASPVVITTWGTDFPERRGDLLSARWTGLPVDAGPERDRAARAAAARRRVVQPRGLVVGHDRPARPGRRDRRARLTAPAPAVGA